MNRFILLIFVFLLCINTSLAWNSKTHESLVENVYYSMPARLQEKLNLSEMKYGSTAPDLVFHDNVRHHFPPSQERAYIFLGNITDLGSFSYNFGVASHYISDSFVSPHYINGENYTLHTKFENQLNKYVIKTACGNYNYTLGDLYVGEKNKNDWELWLNGNDERIPQKEAEQAQQFLFSIAMQMLNYSCGSEMEYDEENLKFNTDTAYLFILVLLIVLILYQFLKHYLSR